MHECPVCAASAEAFFLTPTQVARDFLSAMCDPRVVRSSGKKHG